MTEAAGRRDYKVRAVLRALDVLIAVGDLGRADLTTVARTAGLHPTTALRMLTSLGSRDLVRQRGGRYEIGPGAFELGCRFLHGTSFAAQAQVHVDALAARLGETASLGILAGGDVLYLAVAQGQWELGIQSLPGGREPAYCTALGKVLLADLPPEEVEAVLAARPPVRLTPATVTDPEHLRSELDAVRRQRYAVASEERLPGVVCVAAAIRDRAGRSVAALSVSGPVQRLDRARVPGLAEQVVSAADEASATLGEPAAPAFADE